MNSGVPQKSVLIPLLLLAYFNDIWRINEFNIWLFADNCIISRRIIDSSNIDMLERDLGNLVDRAVEHKMILNPVKIKD